jgi:hypothetical protein
MSGSEALKTVENINLSDSYEKLGEKVYDELEFLTYHSDGIIERIKFLGKTIWDSENNDRKFNEDENEWEPLEPYIREIMIKKLEFLNKQLKCLKGTIQCHCEIENLFEINVHECKDCGKTYF